MELLESGGRVFDQSETNLIMKLIRMYQSLPRKELAFTICENLEWENAGRNLKVDSCLRMLEKLDASGKISIQPIKTRIKREKPPRKLTDLLDIPEKIELLGQAQCFRMSLTLSDDRPQNKLWEDLVERYHYLGYKKNFGLHLKYFIRIDGIKSPIGCLSFAASGSYKLKDRDAHIGWSEQAKKARLNFVINHNRLVVFPWVKIKNLISQVLAQAVVRVAKDWQGKFGFKPLLMETFVDLSKFTGASYRAANWINVGTSAGRRENNSGEKQIFLFPLCTDYREKLCNKQSTPKAKPSVQLSEKSSNNFGKSVQKFKLYENELNLWEKIQLSVCEISETLNQNALRNTKGIDGLTMILATFRIVFAKNRESYNTLLCELLDNANSHGIKLVFGESFAASTFSDVRRRIPPETFAKLNQAIVQHYEASLENLDQYSWFGRRIFGVDGSKVRVPTSLFLESNGGYKKNCDHAYYPQGLLSSLYNLKTKMVHDFSFGSTWNERTEAIAHLDKLGATDVVVYDRGYFSYALLHEHLGKGIDAIFRLPLGSFKVIDAFIKGSETDSTVEILPSPQSFSKIKRKNPFLKKRMSLTLRLLRYEIGSKAYFIGSTVMSEEITACDFKEAYHGRWGHEVMYDQLKNYLKTVELHGRSERLIKQELFAGFNILNLARALSNGVEERINPEKRGHGEFDRLKQVNSKGLLDNLYRKVELVVAGDRHTQIATLERTSAQSAACAYKSRPGRAYPRVSRQPVSKFQKKPKRSKSETPATIG